MAEQTRRSILAIKEEVTEGTPVAPTAATDFIALHAGFALDPAFDSLTNAELRSSLGVAKPITGKEKPKANLDHYIRHSGVEGQAPNNRLLYKAAFGQEDVAGTEYPTIAGSTVALINLAGGIGANFSRGSALLIKDPVNGFSIRPVDTSIADVLTLGFTLDNAPGTGVNLGKAVKYTPANSGHPSLSLWEYRANGAALEVISGSRVTDLSIDVTSGQLIDGKFTMEGVKYHFDPIVILAADTKLDFLDNATTRVATVLAKIYRDPQELAQALQDSMNSLGSGNTFTVVYNSLGTSAGKFTITSTGATLSLLWNTGANAANTIGDKIGFSTAADSTAALTYTSATAQSWAAGFTPTYDNADPQVAKNNEVLFGDTASHLMACVSKMSFKMGLKRQEIDCVAAESGVAGSVLTERVVTCSIVAVLEKHDADKFRRFEQNQQTKFMYTFGTKSGGNWVAGKSAMIYMPTAVIKSFKLGDVGGLVTLEMELAAYVDNAGNGEVYLNFL